MTEKKRTIVIEDTECTIGDFVLFHDLGILKRGKILSIRGFDEMLLTMKDETSAEPYVQQVDPRRVWPDHKSNHEGDLQ